jgi:hypothetical protein
MALTFTDADFKRMQALQADLAIVLRRANTQRLEAAIAAFALVRLARQLLDQYPPTAREALLGVIEAFLERRDLEGEDAGARVLLN